jgi:hypothetical protein
MAGVFVVLIVEQVYQVFHPRHLHLMPRNAQFMPSGLPP